MRNILFERTQCIYFRIAGKIIHFFLRIYSIHLLYACVHLHVIKMRQVRCIQIVLVENEETFDGEVIDSILQVRKMSQNCFSCHLLYTLVAKASGFYNRQKQSMKVREVLKTELSCEFKAEDIQTAVPLNSVPMIDFYIF